MEEMDPEPMMDDDGGMSRRQADRAELDEEQTVFSERTDKVELMGVDKTGRGDKDVYHEDL